MLNLSIIIKTVKKLTTLWIFCYWCVGPNDKRIASNLDHYEYELQASESTGQRGDAGLISDTELYDKANSGSKTDAEIRRALLQDYEKLCRGEVRQQVREFYPSLKKSLALVLKFHSTYDAFNLY